MHKRPFAVNMKLARHKMKLTQLDAADRLKIKRCTLASYEEDRAEPSISILLTICVVYKVSDLRKFIEDYNYFAVTC
jgi:transcriptional regulator with XRE-family HTH domain